MTHRQLGVLIALAAGILAVLLAGRPAAAAPDCHPKCPPKATEVPVSAGTATAAPPAAVTAAPPTLSTIAPGATPNVDPVVVQQSETSIQAQGVSFTPHSDPNAADIGRIAIIVMVVSALIAGGSFWLFLKLR
jgi:hypothetical protein